MYKSTDQLVTNEQGGAQGGYQTVEGGGPVGGTETNVSDVPKTFLSEVKRAKEESGNCCSFCLAFFGLLLASFAWTIVLIIVVTVPIVMIVIGAEYFHDCPEQRMIPIGLIVAGSVIMLSNAINFFDRFKRFTDTGASKVHTAIRWINVFINLFLAAWFVAMCYWVYSSDPSFDNSSDKHYCNRQMFSFSYWLLNFIFIFFGTMVIVSGLVMCVALMCW